MDTGRQTLIDLLKDAFCSSTTSQEATLTERLDTVCRYVRYGELPPRFAQIAYGVQWARQTGRLSGMAEMQLRAIDRAELATLIVDCEADCAAIGDIPRWLNAQIG